MFCGRLVVLLCGVMCDGGSWLMSWYCLWSVMMMVLL